MSIKRSISPVKMGESPVKKPKVDGFQERIHAFQKEFHRRAHRVSLWEDMMKEVQHKEKKKEVKWLSHQTQLVVR